MIAIQSQDKQLWEGTHIGPGVNKDKPVIFCHGYVVGEYRTNEQRDFVLDQIALAIERGDKLYRMPSVEEVEKMANYRGDCCDCKFDEDSVPDGCIYTKECYPQDGFPNWQPKE